jgi:tetratricopeptide (TPR) repeat protein
MKLMRSTAARGLGSCLLLLALALSSCTSSPEARGARFIENGKRQLKNKDAQRAILEFQNAVKATPGNAEAYYQLATAYLAAGDGAHAGTSLRKALELNPKHQAAELLIARFMASTNDKENLQDAQKRLKALLQDTPDDADELYTLALTELKLNQPGDAARDLATASAGAPQAIMISVMLAQAKLQQKDAKGAEEVLRKAIENSPKSVDAVVILGRFYLAQKLLPEAEQQFSQALAMDANNTGALFNLGTVQYEAGKKQEAEQTFRKLSRMRDKGFQGSLAAFLNQEGRKDEALKELERLNKEEPADRRFRTWLINSYVAANRTPDAEKLLNGLLKKNPKDLDALLQRGELALAARNFNQAEIDLNRVVQLQPTSAGVHYILAKLYLARKADLRYRQELAKVLELNPYLLAARLDLAGVLIAGNGSQGSQAALAILNDTPSSQKTLQAVVAQRNWALWGAGDMAEMRKGIDQGLAEGKSTEFLLQDGLWKLRSGNAAGARTALEAALNLNPGDIRALGAIQQTMALQKQSAAALQETRQYAARQPKSAPVQEFLGLMLATQGLQAEARHAFLAAKAADPQSVLADLSLAQLDVAGRKLDDAEHRLQNLVASHSENTTARLWLGNLENAKGNHSAALENFRKAVQTDPDNAQALNNFAYLLADVANQPDEALKYAEKALQVAPDNPQYADTVGWILYQKGLYSAAVQQLERAGSRNGPAVWKYHLAMAYAKAGDMKRGRAVLDSAPKNSADMPEAKAAKELLAARK